MMRIRFLLCSAQTQDLKQKGIGPVNKLLRVGWTIVISLTCSLVVVVVASWGFKIPLSPGVLGLATLGTLLGAIAVFGGVITALISLFTLSSIDDRIIASTAKENERRNNELNERWSQYAFALEKYWAALNDSDLAHAGELMEEAYQLSDESLAVASYSMFRRYWKVTNAWAWDQIDRFDLSRRRAVVNSIPNLLSSTSVLEEYTNVASHLGNQDYSVGCIKWGERALKSPIVPNRASLHLQMAQAYALQRNHTETLEHLRQSLSLNPDQQFHHVANWALLFWNWDDEELILPLFKKIGKERITVTNPQIEKWVETKADNIYQGTMTPIIALEKHASRNTKLTIYSVGSFNGPDGAKLWRIQHGPKSVPEASGWDLDRVVTYVNTNFETLGRTE